MLLQGVKRSFLKYKYPHTFSRLYTLPPNFTLGQPGKSNQQDSFDLRTQDLAETLENDPNISHFYDDKTLAEIKALKDGSVSGDDHLDPYDLSYIPMNENEQTSSQQLVSPQPDLINFSDGPQTMTTEDFMKLMQNEVTGKDPDAYLTEVMNKHIAEQQSESAPTITSTLQQPSLSNTIEQPTEIKDTKLSDFIDNDDIAFFNQPPKLVKLDEILNTELPLIIISKFTDPRINLSLEKYIYDKYPSPKDPINKFAKRLFLYKNSSCIVIGKNQNIFREINLRLASALSIPILRRFSGGGTVVHDLGNMNFSFMCSKDDFSRTQYTSQLVESWNKSFPQNKLEINEKGDMIRMSDQRKISGSAFQISRGKSLHHGTMLLNSDLKTLSKLLKIDPKRKDAITDRATNSIPSPVINTDIDTYSFIDIATKSFVSKFGVPTNLESKLNKQNFNNLSLIKSQNVESQILKLNDLTDLPTEVLETYKQLKDWDWIFAKSPRFQMKMSLDNGNLDLIFDVNKGRVISLDYSVSDDRLTSLIQALSTKDQIVNFSNASLAKYVHDKNLLDQISWNIDHSIDYNNIGISPETL